MSQLLIEDLEKKYVLITRGKLWWFFGGIFAFLIVSGVVSYKSVLSTISSSTQGEVIKELSHLKQQAETDANEIKNMRVNYVDDFNNMKVNLSEIRSQLTADKIIINKQCFKPKTLVLCEYYREIDKKTGHKEFDNFTWVDNEGQCKNLNYSVEKRVKILVEC